MKTRYVYAMLLAMAVSGNAQAQDAGHKIAVVNIQSIMKDSTAAKSVREQLQQKQKTFQSEITKKEEALKAEDQELAKQRSVLSKEAFEKKAEAFRKKATDMQKEVQSKKAMLDNGFEQALTEIQQTTTTIIAELAKEKGFTVAIPTSQILYADTTTDISDDVLEQLNKKLPKLTVKFEAAKN
ncbi:MAG: OmpH family outer membrane protein [Alphaproteobacteria bacterium]